MAKESFDDIRLQLAMAFGQGAGCMLATPDALSYAFSSQAGVVERAVNDWTASRFAFIELVRLAGQVAAARAAVDSRAQIEIEHIRIAIETVMIVCPCLGRFDPRQTI